MFDPSDVPAQKFTHKLTGLNIEIDTSDLEFEFMYSDERQMGSEISYQAITYVEVDGYDYEFKFDIYEYPEGVISQFDVEYDTNEFLSGFHHSVR